MNRFSGMYSNLAQQASTFTHDARNEVVSATIGTNEYICYTENCSYTPTYDAKGNITEYVSVNGNIVAQYQYSAFGEIISQSGMPFTHRFSTKPYCTTIGLIEYQFRKYDPVLGRWLSRDPIEEAGGLNLYAFCGNSIMGVDVLGFGTNLGVQLMDVYGFSHSDFSLMPQPQIDFNSSFEWGSIRFLNCSECQLEMFRIMPEEPSGCNNPNDDLYVPRLGLNKKIDGFWMRGEIKWYKIQNICRATVVCTPNNEFIIMYECMPILWDVVNLFKNNMKPGWYDDSGETDHWSSNPFAK